MVESTNQDDREVDPVEDEHADTTTIEKDGESAELSDESENGEKGTADKEGSADETTTLKPSFWKQYRLGIGVGVLAILVLVAVSQLRWYMNWSAQYALEQRNTKSAMWWIQTAKRILPNDHWKTEFLLARIFRRQNNIEKMEIHLRRAYELPGADILAIDREQTLAQAQNGQINAIGGDEMLRRLFVNHRGDAAEIANAFVHGYLRNRDYNRAQVLLDNWINGFGRLDPEAYLLRAKLYKELQRWAEAEKDLRQVLGSNEKHYIAAWELGDVLRTRKETEEALSYFELACSPDSPIKEEARVAKAHCLRLLGRIDNARSILKDVLAATPGRIDASMQLAMLEMEEDNFKDAIVLLEPLVKLSPRDARLRQNFGIALRNVGRVKEAQRELAFVNQIRNALTKARNLEEQLPKEPKQQVPFRYQIGMLHMEWGAEREALMWFQSLLDIEPNHGPTREAIELMSQKRLVRMKKAADAQTKKVSQPANPKQ